MFLKAGTALLWLAPYLVSGFSAPVIFRHARTPQIGGHFAGALFIFATIWAVLVSVRHRYPLGSEVYFVCFSLLTLLFWAWRFSNGLPLSQSHFLGIKGNFWHSGLTALYLVGALQMALFEFRR